MAASTDLSNGFWQIDAVVGRTLFSTYITMAYANQVEHNIEESAIEAGINRILQMFNYRNALRNLSSEIDVETGQDPQKCLHQAIGFLHRIKPAENYKDIVEKYLVPEMPEIDLQFSASNASFSQSGIAVSRDSGESSPPPYSSTSGVELQATQSQSTSCSDIEIWRYTSRLWEEGTSFGQFPIVKDEMLRSFPPLFRVTVDFKGSRGEGEALNKRQAKHIASKDVCQKLGIILS